MIKPLLFVAVLGTFCYTAVSQICTETGTNIKDSIWFCRGNTRTKRSSIANIVSSGVAFLKGIKAIKSLTKDAVPVIYTEHLQLFRKAGGYQEALEDFEALRPRKVQTVQTPEGVKKTGIVGDRRVEINEHRDISTASLTISKIPGNARFQTGFKTEIIYW